MSHTYNVKFPIYTIFIFYYTQYIYLCLLYVLKLIFVYIEQNPMSVCPSKQDLYLLRDIEPDPFLVWSIDNNHCVTQCH